MHGWAAEVGTLGPLELQPYHPPLSQNQPLSHHPDLLSSLHFLLTDAFCYSLFIAYFPSWEGGLPSEQDPPCSGLPSKPRAEHTCINSKYQPIFRHFHPHHRRELQRRCADAAHCRRLWVIMKCLNPMKAPGTSCLPPKNLAPVE